MKVSIAFFTSLHLLARFASAHPFIIIDPHVTAAPVSPPVPTHHYGARQNLLDDLQNAANSLLGVSSSSAKKQSSSTTSSISMRTIIPPATASATSSSSRSKVTTSSQSDDNSDSQTSTSTSGSSTQTSISSSTTISQTSSASISSTQISPTQTGSSSQGTAVPSTSNDNSNAVPPGGIAVAVIMSLLAVLVVAWLVFRYHPKCQAWYAAREAKKFQERSYRDAIDGPSNNLRSHAMGNGLSRRQTILKSFFAPSTVRLGNGQEIRRKPVNWGADSTHTPSIRSPSPELPPLPIDMEKIPIENSEKISMTAAAAPMGQIERYSFLPQSQPQESAPTVPEKTPELPPKTLAAAISPMSMRANYDMDRLPPISPLSHRGPVERTLPLVPPMPIPSLNIAKRGSDGLFRLN